VYYLGACRIRIFGDKKLLSKRHWAFAPIFFLQRTWQTKKGYPLYPLRGAGLLVITPTKSKFNFIG
jgi:hypothetical protein